MSTKISFVDQDIEWCEKRLAEWQKFVDDNPIDKLTTQIETLNGKDVVVATIQVQGKFIQETIKNIIAMTEALDKLREKEEAKFEARGGAKISAIQGRFLKNK